MIVMIGIVLIIAGIFAVYNLYSLADVGLLVVIAGIFLVMCGAFNVKAEAETTGGAYGRYYESDVGIHYYIYRAGGGRIED